MVNIIPDVRFIPTPVGNTSKTSKYMLGKAVHPHACGEHFSFPLTLGAGFGSSPRLWGTLIVTDVTDINLRFIPTPVGNTLALFKTVKNTAVHPHACGEHNYVSFHLFLFIDSSPRLWGTQTAELVARLKGRFIPTPVGNTHVE